MVGDAVREFLVSNGLDQRQQVARVLEGWSGLVGQDVAAHVVVESFDQGHLLLRADSTTWANQMRLLQATLERRLTQELGEGAVASITVLGPDAPSWRFGTRRVPGRGPRDTYG
jgi:predicted nucleic acid-binding Zn ribbon protein